MLDEAFCRRGEGARSACLVSIFNFAAFTSTFHLPRRFFIFDGVVKKGLLTISILCSIYIDTNLIDAIYTG